ncbi:MAG: beta-ketoacyl-ACP synthase [Burkholderiaceae bacterium]
MTFRELTMLYLNQCGIVCALGDTHSAIKARLFEHAQSGVVTTGTWSAGRILPLGQVDAQLPSMAAWPIQQRSRNNQMALAALAQIRSAVDAAIARFGTDRIGVVVGTSTSGIAGTESALRQYVVDGTLPGDFHYGQQEMGSPASMLANELGISGPAYVHSSACASSAKALASAARLINMGLCDAVLTGGVDSLCAFTVAGFSALESVSAVQCNPLSLNRNGINIGEGAALFLMTREPSAVALCGWGESSDGHHMSAPDPAGGGARLSITQALQRAGLQASQIDYINLHGTATIQNDAMESRVVHNLFGFGVPVSSTKPFTGHALGAAAAIEAALCWLAMQDDNVEGRLPPHLWDGVADPGLPALNVVAPGMRLGRPLQWALSNSFAFGGSNATLVLGRVA